MQKARMLGNYIQKLSMEHDVSISELSELLSCSEYEIASLLKGRAFAAFDQLELLAQRFNVTVTDLLAGDNDYYNKTVVHCMTKFQDINNREFILDIIDDYMDIINAVE